MSDRRISPAQRYVWSVRRELWENRSIYLAPSVLGALVLLGFGVWLVALPARLRAASATGGAPPIELIERPFVTAALVLMATELIVAVFYCVDALYADRKDRSILFWKTLPVSDVTTVLAKASIPILVLPIVTCAVTIVAHGIMLLTTAGVMRASGFSTAILWTHVPFVETARISLEHLLLLHGIWYAPFYAWLLLTSAWAPRLPFVWAVLPPVAVAVLERIAFDTTFFASMVQTHLFGGPAGSFENGPEVHMSMGSLAPYRFDRFVLAPELWVGLCVAGILLAGAVQLRRYRPSQ